MKLDNRIKVKANVQFQNLAIGDVYEDDDGIICIKTGDDSCAGSPYGKCIAFVDNEWREEEEHIGTYVTPLEATVTLHGYKTQER
jgi:hypothetical protein